MGTNNKGDNSLLPNDTNLWYVFRTMAQNYENRSKLHVLIQMCVIPV